MDYLEYREWSLAVKLEEPHNQETRQERVEDLWLSFIDEMEPFNTGVETQYLLHYYGPEDLSIISQLKNDYAGMHCEVIYLDGFRIVSILEGRMSDRDVDSVLKIVTQLINRKVSYLRGEWHRRLFRVSKKSYSSRETPTCFEEALRAMQGEILELVSYNTHLTLVEKLVMLGSLYKNMLGLPTGLERLKVVKRYTDADKQKFELAHPDYPYNVEGVL